MFIWVQNEEPGWLMWDEGHCQRRHACHEKWSFGCDVIWFNLIWFTRTITGSPSWDNYPVNISSPNGGCYYVRTLQWWGPPFVDPCYVSKRVPISCLCAPFCIILAGNEKTNNNLQPVCKACICYLKAHILLKVSYLSWSLRITKDVFFPLGLSR